MKGWILVLLLVACQRHVVVSGTTKLSVQDLRARWEQSGKPKVADVRAFVLEAVHLQTLRDEAIRRGLGAADAPAPVLVSALHDAVAREVMTALPPQEVSDAQLLPYYEANQKFRYLPRRASTTGAVFARLADAEQFRKQARAASFREDFQRALDRIRAKGRVSPNDPPIAEIWDFDVSANPAPRLPQALAAPALAAVPGEIVGPVSGTGAAFPSERHFVCLVREQLPEVNAFAEVKETMRDMVYMEIVEEQTEQRLQQITQKTAIINDEELASLRFFVSSTR